MVICTAAAFLAVFALALSGLQEQRNQHQLYAKLRGLLDPASPVAPSIGGRIPSGTPIALLNAPDAGIHNVVVVEGTTSGDLLSGPGHLRDTPLPGQVGDSVLMGRGVTAGAPFRSISRLRPGQVITTTTGQGQFLYVVIGPRHDGDPLPSYRANGGILTLTSSIGTSPLGLGSGGHLIYVDARLEGTAVPAPAGRPTRVAAAEAAGQGDTAAWPWAAGWFGLLAAAAAGAWMIWARWGMLRAWLLCAPIFLGILWGLATELTRLLPNVY
jgi:sortase A